MHEIEQVRREMTYQKVGRNEGQIVTTKITFREPHQESKAQCGLPSSLGNGIDQGVCGSPAQDASRGDAVQALRHSEARLRTIIDTAVDAIITINGRGIILSANLATEKMFGYAAKHILGQNVKMLMPEPYRREHDGYLANYLRTGVKKIIGIGREVSAQRKDGSVFPVDLAVAVVPGEEEPLFTGIIRDMTDRKTNEERLRIADRLAAIGTLAAGLGHDMNNVLLPVRARLNALKRDKLSKGAQQHIEEIRKSLAYLQQLTDGLHLLALNPEDAEAGEKSTDLSEWWIQVGPLMAKAVPKRVAFTAVVPQGLPPVAVPPHQLTQGILNLVVNAGDAIASMGQKKGGRVKLEIRWLPARWEVELSVSDNGPGMTPEVKARAFDPFFTTKKRGLGTGLGLSMVRGVVQSAGGGLALTSELGQGTRVALTLPVVAQAQEGRAAATSKAVVSMTDPRAGAFIAAMLEAAGMTVRQHSSTLEASPGDDAALWVVEAGRSGDESVRQYCHDGRAVVAVGKSVGRTLPQGRGFFVVEDVNDPEALRDALAQAMEWIQGDEA